MTKFGIIISTYLRNDGKTPELLNRALKSIKSQKHTEYKVFLIGDKYENLTDFDIFGKDLFNEDKFYKENLPFAKERDKYHNNKNALWSYGGCFANNYGIDLALKQGFEYICRLDHDDYWEETHLQNFDYLIKKYDAHWMCSLSTHPTLGVLPKIDTDSFFVKWLPDARKCVKSSTCVNTLKIPLRTKNVFEESGKVSLPGDADLWVRTKKFIIENKLNSFVINKLTCYHDEEGHTKK